MYRVKAVCPYNRDGLTIEVKCGLIPEEGNTEKYI